MAERRKKSLREKAPTVVTKEPKKKKGKEKKPTVGISSESGGEKLEAKPVKLRKGKEPKKGKDRRVEALIAPVKPSDEPKRTAEDLRPVEISLPGKTASKEDEPKPEETAPVSPEETVPVPEEAVPEPVKTRSAPRLKRRMRVLFVCTGNTCRSAMMQYIFEDFMKGKGESAYVDVRSAGLSALNGDDMSEQAKQALFELGITGINHFAGRLTPEMVHSSDLVVCMTENHARAIGALPNVTTIARITGGADVADPWGGSLDDYRKVAAYLKYACDDVYEALVKLSV